MGPSVIAVTVYIATPPPSRHSPNTATAATDFRSARAKNTAPAYISRIYVYIRFIIYTPRSHSQYLHTRGHGIYLYNNNNVYISAADGLFYTIIISFLFTTLSPTPAARTGPLLKADII